MNTRNTTWGHDANPLLTLDEAWSRISDEVKPLDSESVPLAEAHRRVLATPIHATSDWPAFDKAMMDGFAVRSADCKSPGSTLKIVGLVAAGAASDQSLSPHQAFRINTGAPLPQGADAVVRIEDSQIAADNATVEIQTIVEPRKHVALKGTDRKFGELLLAPPLTLEAAQLAALAAAGLDKVSAYQQVTAAIVLTGNEIIPAGSPLQPGQIHDSNGPMLAALMQQFGAVPARIGIARDDDADLRNQLRLALQSPVVITVGGMSMGTLDLVPKTCAELGVTWRFHGVSMRPGKPVAYGRGPDGQHVFGLPGNPVSAFVCSWLFVRMAVRGLVGHPVTPPHRLRATLTRDIKPKRDPRPAFVPAHFWNHSKAGELVEPCAWGGSGDPFGLAMANALLVLDNPTIGLSSDETVEVIPITSEL